ncbi:hypothetical protein B0H11DRAFT_1914950 [Mycena galericulata]|nr:hypothetical protein B0H11DRAFT_1914950 [Mycena galericulata]
MSATTHRELATQLAQSLHLTTEGFKPLRGKKYTIARNKVAIFVMKLEEDSVQNDDDDGHDSEQLIILASILTLIATGLTYLPSLVLAYKKMPDSRSPYAMLLSSVVGEPYFGNIMRSPLGSDLYTFHATQMVKQSVSLSDNGEKTRAILDSIFVMFQLMMYAGFYHRYVQPLSKGVHNQVIDWLDCVADNSNRVLHPHLSSHVRTRPSAVGAMDHSCICHFATRILCVLNGSISVHETLQGGLFFIPWIMCGAVRQHCYKPNCLQHEPMMLKDERYSCTRCRAMTYCSKEHQQLDWPPERLPKVINSSASKRNTDSS